MSAAAFWRSHACGELRATDEGTEVVLAGWVANRRDHGVVRFVDLRDRYGIIQLIADEDAPEAGMEGLTGLHPEDVLQVKGIVRMRVAGQRNSDRPTGEVEVLVHSVEKLSSAARLPFEIADHIDVPEEMLMRYRYLDMRRTPLQERMALRTKANHAFRTALIGEGFLEIETPMMTKSTPEGARDYLVPSRSRQGSWYALPQSPQLFKQLCMVGGMDKYFQIARCMRDEDLRADRQPEFTQLDMEMSFVDEEDIYGLVERAMAAVYQEVKGEELALPLERMPYEESIRRYASDKPDLRNPIEIVNLAQEGGQLSFALFDKVLQSGGWVRGIRVPGGAALSRKQIDSIEAAAKDAGAGGAAWCKVSEEGPTGPLSRFLQVAEGETPVDCPVKIGGLSEGGAALLKSLEAMPGDLVVTIADAPRRALVALDAIRRQAGDLMDLVQGPDRLLWITEFPLFEVNDDGAFHPAHHPFTCPVLEDIPALEAGGKEGIRSRAYDLVLNGVELGSGSVRIHERKLQETIFKAIGFAPEVAQERFAFLLEAFRYGAPPHAGFAIGLDRLYALLFNAKTIRDVIAFPKTATGSCPLTGAPSAVDETQLRELGIEQQIPATINEA
ncbi:MAG: aspartate--tRNA ligase [Planctomycetota bacterium]|nr:aspartate--tRNA ligase [Planctomycetota bacterium]MDA1112971.1 aspartate--tRNA ligase [Planctomycetota bacterium]